MGDDIPDLSAVDGQQLLDGLDTAVVVANDQSRIIYLNNNGADLLGWTRRDLIGRPLVSIIPERLRPLHVDAFARYLATGAGRLVGAGPVRFPALRADGAEVEVEVSLTVHELAGDRKVFVASIRDLTERLALEHERALARYLLTMREITRRLAAAQDASSPEDAAPVILAAIGETLAWDLGGMWVVQGDGLRPRHRWSAPGFEEAASDMEQEDQRLRTGEGLPGRVLASGEAAWVEDFRRDPNFPRRPIAERHGLRSGFAFPIVTHGRVVAVVEFCSATRREAEPDLLPAMASAGAEIGRLIEREEARRHAALAHEHLIGMAEALQASLLPPRPPVIPGLELAARYRAAAGEGQVGGDFFDVFPLADGGWAVAIGDVSGRGPKAAALTALARYTLRAAAVTARGSDVLRVLNDVVLQELEATDELGEQFLTVAFLVLEPTAVGMSLELVCGGHPAPLLLRQSGKVEEATCQGELVGVFEAWEATDVDLVLDPGDAIVLYTDGAIEGKGATGQFGEERLRSVLAAASGLHAEDIARMLETAVLDYVGDGSQDDMAIVVVRLPGGGDHRGRRSTMVSAPVPEATPTAAGS